MFTIAIIGRPNVGKSTLFNCIAGKALAIVDDTPGVTRDWRETPIDFYGTPVLLMDTAGLEDAPDDSIAGRMRLQTQEAVRRADAIIFVVDGRAGVTPLDAHYAAWIRKQKKPTVVAVNKCENEKTVQTAMAEAYALGFGEPIALSAAHGMGIHDLYEVLRPHFPAIPADDTGDDNNDINLGDIDALEGDESFDFAALALNETETEKPIKIAIVGRPNAGKSTLLNALLKEPRVITGPEAGLTRDSIAVDWIFEGRKIKLIDTAGLRKKAKVVQKIEKMAVDDTLRAIRLAQVVIMMVDPDGLFEKQDQQICDHVLNEGRVLIIALNKWDAITDKKNTLDELAYRLSTGLAQVKDLPIVPISALEGRNLEILMKTVLESYDLWTKRISTSKMNRWLAARESQNPAPLVNGRPNRLKYMTQINIRPPTFALWVSRAGELPDPYKRYIINALREDFNLKGIPVRLLVRASKNPFSEE